MPRKSNETETETIAYRLTEILRRLNEGERLDPQGLVDEFKVNLRTIQRDLNERFSFLDLEKKDGLYAVNHMRLGMLSFADVQRFASLAGLQGMNPFRYTQVALYRSQSPVNARKCLISIGIDFR